MVFSFLFGVFCFDFFGWVFFFLGEGGEVEEAKGGNISHMAACCCFLFFLLVGFEM